MRYTDKIALILNDDEVMRSLLVEMLRPFQFALIRKADSVLDLQKMDALEKVDLCIVDWVLRGTDGPRFLHRLRRGGFNLRPDVRTVLTIDAADRETVLQARDAGANAVIGKPFSRQMVGNAVTRALEDGRPFVVSPTYVGPDRRVRRIAVPEDRREREAASRTAA
ncbi:MAG TPA: response regulator [Alphaproteobacteria bacterium]|nr:response regulator [Alphaproteobacteria bacterium]